MVDPYIDIRLQIEDIDSQKFTDVMSTLWYADLDVHMNGKRRAYTVKDDGLHDALTVDLEFECKKSKWAEIYKELETIFNE